MFTLSPPPAHPPFCPPPLPLYIVLSCMFCWYWIQLPCSLGLMFLNLPLLSCVHPFTLCFVGWDTRKWLHMSGLEAVNYLQRNSQLLMFGCGEMEEQASRQYLFLVFWFFFWIAFFSWPCNTMGLCFVSCHSQKNTDVKQKVLWLMVDQRRQRWQKAVGFICTQNHSSLSHQECLAQPTPRARAACLSLVTLCWKKPQNCAEHGAVWAG